MPDHKDSAGVDPLPHRRPTMPNAESLHSNPRKQLRCAGSILCVGSEWHRYPSSFFVPSYISEVRWIDDGFRGLLPFPFNETLGGTTAAPTYFNDKNKASDKQYLKDIGACNLLMELDLRRPYPSRGNDLSTWETLAALPFLDRELSPALYRSFFIPYQWQHKNVFGLYKLLRRLPTDQEQPKSN